MQKVNQRKRGPFSLLIGFLAVSLLVLLSGTKTADPKESREWNGSMQSSSSQIFEGILNIVWGDPDPEFGSGGETRYTLALSSGTSVPLQLTGQDNVAAYFFGKRVVVSGRVVPNRFGTTYTQDPWAILVDTITPNQAQQEVQDTIASVFGTKKVIFLLLRFSDDTAVPHPPNFYTDLINPDTPPGGEVFPATINGFFKKTSWNQFYWVGDVGGMGGVGASGGWLTLPHPKNYYAPCGWSGGCFDWKTSADDGMALGRAQGITFTNYDNVNFVFSNDLDCCALGGSYYSSVDRKSYGATWEPPWGQEAGTYSHEMGHSIGLPHSGWMYYAYDSPWDVMSDRTSANSVNCGSYNSINNNSSRYLYCSEPGDGYIAGHKDYLGWIPLANEVVTDTSSSMTVTLEADALPLSTAAKIIKICITGSPCAGSAAHYFTVEARAQGLGTTSQFDNGIPGDGIIIHEFLMNRPPIGGPCFFNSQSGWAMPIDSNPNDYDSVLCNFGGRSYPNYALFNAQWSPGQIYTNCTYGLSIQVVSRTGPTFVVSVNPKVTSVSLSVPVAGAIATSTIGSPCSVQVGYAAANVTSGSAPYGTAVFSFAQNNVVVSEAGVPASPTTTAARFFVDYRSGVTAVPARSDAGSIDIDTGLALANPGSAMANVVYTLRRADGVTLTTGHGTIAGGSHYAKFVDQLKDVAPDFNLPSNFPTSTQLQFASLQVSSDQPLSILALRQSTNQRKEAIFTTTPIADLTLPITNTPIYFPQFADGGGYTTALILLNISNGTETGTLQILDDNGNPLIVNQVGGTTGSALRYTIPSGGVSRLQTDGSPAIPKVGWAQLTPDSGTSTPIGAGVFSYNPASTLVTEAGIPAAVATTLARIYVDLSAAHDTGLAIANTTTATAAISLRAFQLDGITGAGTSRGSLPLAANGHSAQFIEKLVTGFPAEFTGVLEISSPTPFAALTVRSLYNERNDFLMTTFPIADATRSAPTPIVFPQIADGGGYLTQFILLSAGGASSTTIKFYDEAGHPLAVGK